MCCRRHPEPEGHDGVGRVCHNAAMDKVNAQDRLPQGFPTPIAGRTDGDVYSLITHGYQGRDAVTDIIEAWRTAQEAS